MFVTPSMLLIRLSTLLISQSRWRKVALMLVVDMLSLPWCFTIALLLRVGDVDTALAFGAMPSLLITLMTIPVFAVTGLYGAVIRFIDWRLLSATGVGLALVVATTYLLSFIANYYGLPHTVVMIYWFIAFSYVVTSRLLARALLRRRFAAAYGDTATVTAIYGAGEAGVKLALAMRASGKYHPVCFFDDKPSLHHRNVAGLKVMAPQVLAATAGQRHISLIVIAIPSATIEQRRRILYRVQQAGVEVKILGSLVALADEAVSVQAIREIKIDDLLGREPILPQAGLFARCIQGQNVLVTGAGGSIGSELCRQIVTLAPRRLHLIDHCEHALYNITQELTRWGTVPIHAHLGSVTNAALVARIMGEGQIDTVYHAAAYKHVPLVEANMAEGVRNNIAGADVIASAAEKFHVKTCVLISSDKAVRPTSIMGASKRIAELIFQAAAMRQKSTTKFCMVRFGNVLGSSGSVVPLFKDQIERGGPITITHPEVVRYFMSICEAAQLVIQAGAMATGGDVFVMDMGEPVKIVDLARTMIALSGLQERDHKNPGGDVEIAFVGLRPGEKLYEELFAGDNALPSKHPRIMTTTEYAVAPEVLAQQIAYLMVACATNDKAMITLLVQRLVRGYVQTSVEGMDPRAADIVKPCFATDRSREGNNAIHLM